MPETPDETHARLMREQARAQRLLTIAEDYDQLAATWEKQVAREVEQFAAGDAWRDTPLNEQMRQALLAKAAEHREWASKRRELGEAMQKEVVTEWQARPDLRPGWAPKPTMAEELRAHEAKAELRERGGREWKRDDRERE